MSNNSTLLMASLETAVFFKIAELKQCEWIDPIELLEKKRDRIIETLSSQGDIILYKGARDGETTAAFNELVEAIALMSFAPGGVEFMGRKWINR